METKYKIHAFYILSFLILTIVILVSVKWGDIPSLTQYFSFALTLSSLLLAVLAIIYSFYSSSTNSQNIATLSSLSNQIAGSTSSLSASSDEIGKYIEALPIHLKNVQGKVEETQQMIREYYQAQSAPGTAKQPELSKLSTELADRILSKSSFAGLGLIYGCSLALTSRSETKINFKDFALKSRLATSEYFYGYAVAARSIGILSAETADGILTINEIHPAISKGVKSMIYKRAEESPSPSEWKANIASIEKLVTPT